MRKLLLLTSLLVTWLTCVPALAAPTLAATSTDFYAGLLQRGVTDVEAGRFEDAITPLRLAAFGLVDTIESYETSLVYLAVALNNTEQSFRVAEVLQRILAAERVERRFASLPLPPSIRTQFDALARTQLSPAEVAALATGATAPATGAPRQTASAVNPPARTGPAVAEPKRAPTKVSPPAATQPAPVKQEPKQIQKPQPVQVSTPKQTVAPPQTRTSQVVESKPVLKAPPAKPAVPVADVSPRLAAAERALSTGSLNEARRIYRELLATPNLEHAMWIRVAEGLYRSRDFIGALAAFDKVKSLRPGEEAYRYYVAVALYETGQFARARQELAAALPYIEQTPDVLRYRKKIEDAR